MLESGESIIIFRNRVGVMGGIYESDESLSAQLAAGSINSRCIGNSTMKNGSIEPPGTVHIVDITNSSVSVGQACVLNKVVLFTSRRSRCYRYLKI